MIWYLGLSLVILVLHFKFLQKRLDKVGSIHKYLNDKLL